MLLTAGAALAAHAAEVYVAPIGNDASPGTREQPFAALELGAEDSGTVEAPVVYSAAPGERVTLSGGTLLQREWFAPVTDDAILQRVVTPEARAHVLQAGLTAHGITDYGELTRRGFHKANAGGTPPLELYVGDRQLTRVRWPNPDEHFPEYLRGVQTERRGAVGRSGMVDKGPTAADADFMDRGGVFTYAFDRPAPCTQADDIWLDGVFAWSWEWSYDEVNSIDLEPKEVTLRYGEVSGIADQYSFDCFFAENLLEEIDQPGEYYLDRTRGLLCPLPPGERPCRPQYQGNEAPQNAPSRRRWG